MEASWSRKTADFLWGINSSLTFGLSDLFAKPDSVCTDSEYYTGGVYTADAVTLVVAPVKGAVNTGVKKIGSHAIGSYSSIKNAAKGVYTTPFPGRVASALGAKSTEVKIVINKSSQMSPTYFPGNIKVTRVTGFEVLP